MTPVTFFLATTISTAAISLRVWLTDSVCASRNLARSFRAFSVVVSAAALLLVILRARDFAHAAPQLLVSILIYRGWIVVGTAMSASIFILASRQGGARPSLVARASVLRAFVASPHVLTGLCVSVTCSFLAVEIGKLAHDADMRMFFTQSGFPVWFLYVTMILETVGAACLLVPRLRMAAACGLIVIMLGAIATHANNGDPFSDSLEAVHLLLLLVGIIVVGFSRSSVREAA